MADTDVSPVADIASTPKKSPKKEKKASRPKVSHPSTAIMVNAAIQSLKERGGSSLQAIKKYIAATYKVDAEKFAPFIKKYLKSSVVSGGLVQTKGKGASGSFKMPTVGTTKAPAKSKKPSKKPVAVKPKAKVVKPTAVTMAVTKKSPVKKAAAKPKRASPTRVAAKTKSPSKAKKTAKAPTKKPKSPKPKTTKAKAVAKSPKRAAPKRK